MCLSIYTYLHAWRKLQRITLRRRGRVKEGSQRDLGLYFDQPLYVSMDYL